MVPDALSRLVTETVLPQTINNEMPSFDDPLLFLNRSCTPSTPVLTTLPPPPNGPPPGVVVLATNRAQRANQTSVHSTHSPPEPAVSSTDFNEFEDDCWDSTDEVDPFGIERATDNSPHVHLELYKLSLSPRL